MASCYNHRDREAVVKCRRCGKGYCDACVDKLGETYYCFDCMKEMIQESREPERTSKLNAALAAGAFIQLAIGIVLLWAGRATLSALIAAAQAGNAQAFLMAGGGASALAVPIAGALLCVGLAVGIFANKKLAYYLGLLFNIALLGYNAYGLSNRTVAEPALSIVLIAGPLIVLLALLLNRGVFK